MRRRAASARSRGAGALEYTLLLFVIICVAFVAWKYLGNSVKGSTQQADTRFQKSGDSVAAAGAGGGAGEKSASGGGAAAKAGAGGAKAGADNERTGTPGGAAVATVSKPGAGGAVADNRGASGHAAAEAEAAPKPRNWMRYFLIGILVVGLMAAVYTFGKKKSPAS